MVINLCTVLIFFIDEGRISEFLKVPKGEVASMYSKLLLWVHLLPVFSFNFSLLCSVNYSHYSRDDQN